MKCLVCDDLGEPHHVKARGAGGRDWHCVPLCRRHHNEGDAPNSGWLTFQRKYNVNLMFAARILHEAWLKPRPPGEN